MMIMDRFKKLRRVVWLLVVLAVLNIILLALMLSLDSFMEWAVLITQAVVVLYFTVVALGLVKEIEDGENKSDRNSI